MASNAISASLFTPFVLRQAFRLEQEIVKWIQWKNWKNLLKTSATRESSVPRGVIRLRLTECAAVFRRQLRQIEIISFDWALTPNFGTLAYW